MTTTSDAQPINIHRLPGSSIAISWTPWLSIREQPPASGDRSRPVLYIHGATFPSALSVMFKFQGRSWADHLNAAGHDVFALDFAGYGGSERYPGMKDANGPKGDPLGRTDVAADQIERAVRFIMSSTGAPRVSIIAHSWGTIAAGRFAAAHPDLVDKLVLFAPVTQREGPTQYDPPERWSLVTIAAQHERFLSEVPAAEPSVLIESDFPRWASEYLESDPESALPKPHAVKVPAGPGADVDDAWSGHLAYDPAKIQAPTLIVRGEWDTTTTDHDVAWLKSHLTGSALVADVKVPKSTHLMHLEYGRDQLYDATEKFLENTAQASANAQKGLFAVVFLVKPNPAHEQDYLRIAGELRPRLEQMAGFVENERFRSRTDPGTLLSLSLWDDEAALIRWRTFEQHHRGQVEGRNGVLSGYRLRVGEVVAARGAFADRQLGREMRVPTEGTKKALTIVDGAEISGRPGCEVFDLLTDPKRHATLCEWPDDETANAYLNALGTSTRANAYAIRVIRDYGPEDRREAPQFMEPVDTTGR